MTAVVTPRGEGRSRCVYTSAKPRGRASAVTFLTHLSKSVPPVGCLDTIQLNIKETSTARDATSKTRTPCRWSRKFTRSTRSRNALRAPCRQPHACLCTSC